MTNEKIEPINTWFLKYKAMSDKLDLLQPRCCCVRRYPVYPEVHLMENSIIMAFFALCAVISAYIKEDKGVLISSFTCGYGLILVYSAYLDVQSKYYEKLQKDEIETDGDSVDEIKETKDVGTETSSEEGDDSKSEYSDIASQTCSDTVPSHRRRRVIKIKKTSAVPVDELCQEDRVLQQLRQFEREVAKRNEERRLVSK